MASLANGSLCSGVSAARSMYGKDQRILIRRGILSGGRWTYAIADLRSVPTASHESANNPYVRARDSRIAVPPLVSAAAADVSPNKHARAPSPLPPGSTVFLPPLSAPLGPCISLSGVATLGTQTGERAMRRTGISVTSLRSQKRIDCRKGMEPTLEQYRVT